MPKLWEHIWLYLVIHRHQCWGQFWSTKMDDPRYFFRTAETGIRLTDLPSKLPYLPSFHCLNLVLLLENKPSELTLTKYKTTSSKQTLWTLHSQGWQGQVSEIKKLTKTWMDCWPFLSYLTPKKGAFCWLSHNYPLKSKHASLSRWFF